MSKKNIRKQVRRISTRLSAEQREVIEEKIVKGEYKNLSEFLRTAIEEAVGGHLENE